MNGLLNRQSPLSLGLVILVATLAASFTTKSLLGQTPPTDPEKLVRDLASPHFTVREAAQRELLALGAVAKSALESAHASSDVEQRMRAEFVLRELSRAALWESSPITVDEKNATAKSLFDEIAKQSGNPINWDRTPKGLPESLSLTVHDRPYWEVLDQLCENAKVTAQFYDDPFRLGMQLTRGEPGRFPTASNGPLRLRLVTCRRALNQELNYGDRQTDSQDSLALSLVLNWEQRFAMCRYSGRPRILEARTDTGEDLRHDRRIPEVVMPVSRRQRQLGLNANLKPYSGQPKMLRVLRIAMDVEVAGEFLALSVPLGKADALAAEAGYELRLLDNGKQEPRRFTIAWSRREPYDKANLSDMVDEYFEAVSAEGTVIQVNPLSVLGDRHAVKYTFIAARTRPVELRMNVARLRSRRTVEFAFYDVPLPQ